MIRWAQVLAISFVGVGALVLTYQGYLDQAMFLYGALGAYGLKNGVGLAVNQATSTTASIANSPKPSGSSTDNEHSAITSRDSLQTTSLLELADEGYENSW